MAKYRNNENVIKFDFGINLITNFFWWATIKNKEKALIVFEVEKGFVFKEATSQEKKDFYLEVDEDKLNSNEKIGRAKNEEDLKKIFLKSKFHLRFELFEKTKNKKELEKDKFEKDEEENRAIAELVEMSL